MIGVTSLSSDSTTTTTLTSDDTSATSNPPVKVAAVAVAPAAVPMAGVRVDRVGVAEVPVDPVVSSKYGARPLLEVPALNVGSDPTRLEISSLENRPKPYNIVHRLDATNLLHKEQKKVPPPQPEPQPQPPPQPQPQQPQYQQVSSLVPAGAMTMTVPVHMQDFDGVPGSIFGPPPGSRQGPRQNYGGNVANVVHSQFVNVPNMPLPAPGYKVLDSSGNPVPAPTHAPQPGPPMMPMGGPGYYPQPNFQPPPPQPHFHPPPPQPYPQPFPQPAAYSQPQYPGPQPYPQPQYPGMGGYPPPQPPGPPGHTPDNFMVEGVLEYGRLTTIHFRDRNTSSFRGLPEFLRLELEKTYGKFPLTDIRIVAQHGEFHIYATPRNTAQQPNSTAGSEADPLDDFNGQGARPYSAASAGQRMIGFNHVVGNPRAL